MGRWFTTRLGEVKISLVIPSLALALPAPQASAIPSGYRKVYITSAVDTKYVVVPKAATAANGGLVVVYVLFLHLCLASLHLVV